MIAPTPHQRLQFIEEGYVVVDDALVGDDLLRLQTAFDRCAAESRAEWLDGICKGTRPAGFFDIPSPFERDDAFIDLIDHPSWYGLLMDFTDNELILLAPQVRVLPPSPISYVGWHPDVPQTNPLHIKVQIYVDDVARDQGPFCYVPGSHKSDAGPYPRVRRLESMPGHRVFPGKAGTAILFNSYGWHTSMVNSTSRPRKSIILIYEKWTEGRVDADRYAGIADRLKTPARQRLFSLKPAGGGP
ncbi:MAG: phytanoyl-CoA dioxygenase family protein [bacterium]|nr:phytanoyl-CoA dioxygenase family protein [bacterium]